MNKNLNYIDTTKYWLSKTRPRINRIIIDKKYIDDFKIIHPIKNKEIACIATRNSEEYQIAIIFKKIFGGIIHMPPRIIDISNTGISTPTPDYIWNNEKWDLKTPTKKGNFNTSIERFFKKVKKAKKQANKYIINFKYFKERDDEEIIALASNILESPHRDFIKALILIDNDRVIKIYERK